MTRKRLLPVVAAAVLVVVAVLALRWATVWRHVESTDDAYVEGDITAMAPKVAAHVVEVAVADNQAVEQGQVLVRLDPRDFAAKVAEARAVVAARRAARAQLDDRVAVQQATAAGAAAGIAAANADLKRARQDLDRTQRLIKEDFVSRQRLDLQQADAAKAAAGVQGTGAQLTAARRQLGVLESERAVADAQIAQAEAQLALAEADLEATTIRAPVAGVIGNRAVRLGQYVRPGQYLLAVVPLDGVWVDANFKETQIGTMKPGHKATVIADSWPDIVLDGHVAGFAPASGAKFSLLPPENATGNFTKVVQRVPVRIALVPGHPLAGRLRPGLSVTVRVDTRE
ncbi:MAG: HlyD family secretion protein [Magnetospirillum sp.]|nr:HlyD family secretion protein [Magnetospirillum sp.]